MHIKKTLVSISSLAIVVAAGLFSSAPAQAGNDPYLGDIMPVAFPFCPRGWAGADGQLLPINQNQALFSLFGTTYGGDGRTTFALPDLRGRTPINHGQGPGLSNRALGSKGGSETNVMTVAQMPPHSHAAGIRTLSGAPNTNSPVGATFGVQAGPAYNNSATPTGRFMNAGAVGVESTGLGQAQNNMQPSLTIRYCVSLQGVFPSRN